MKEAPFRFEHIRSEHLFEVATTQDRRLTPEELRHLRSCGACSDRFAQIVFDYVHANDGTATKHAKLEG